MVKGETQFKWVRVRQTLASLSLSLLVRSQGFLGNLRLLVRGRVLSDVAHEVGLHFVVKDLSIVALHVRHQGVIQKVQDVLADARQLVLNLLLVVLDFLDVLCVTFDVLLFLDRREDPPGCSSRTDNVLECNCQDVSLLDIELLGARLSELS